MRTTSNRGFTLLELLVALTIAAALFAILIPSVRPNANAQLATSARAIANALRLSRMQAIALNRPEAFVVDTRNTSYRTGNVSDVHRLPSGIRVALYTTSDETLGPTVGTIRFYPDGSSTGGGVALDGDQASYDVLVDWLTGGVSIHERAKSNR